MTVRTFKVFQFQLTNEQIDAVNAAPRDKTPSYYYEYLDVTFGKPDAVNRAWNQNNFTYVADIQAETLEGAFRIGNIGPDEAITRIADSMSSVSVGNVIEDEDGKLFVVASFGFDEFEPQ